MRSNTAIYLIEADPMLSAVKTHIAECQRVHDAVITLAERFGANRISTDPLDGTLRSVTFSGERHGDFTKPQGRHGLCGPKKGTEAAKLFKAQKGHANASATIANAFKVPLTLTFKSAEGEGWTRIGSPLSECGFLSLGVDGPHGLWIPDVPAEVAEQARRGRQVIEAFDMVLPGCRRILEEEWDLLVAQDDLQKAKEKQALEAAELA